MVGGGRVADVADPIQAADVDPHAERHADAGGAEAPVPGMPRVQPPADQDLLEAFVLREVAGHERGGECADVDAHVEQREPGVAPAVAAAVEPADECADAGLEQAGADRDQDQARVEGRDGVERERVVAGGDDEAADEHGPAGPDEVVGDEPAQDAEHVARHHVVAVDRRGVRLREAQPAGRHRGDHEEHEERPHPVIGETLPELGEEEVAQALGVPGDATPVEILRHVGGRVGDRARRAHAGRPKASGNSLFRQRLWVLWAGRR